MDPVAVDVGRADATTQSLALPATPSPARTGIEALLRPAGVSITVPRGPVGEGCAGSAGVTVPRRRDTGQDFAALTRCARTLKSTEPGLESGEITIRATNETSYQEVIALLDALRNDSKGDLFPSPSFGLAPESSVVRQRPPVRAVLSSGEDEGILVLVSKSLVVVDGLLGEDRVLVYDGPESARATGLPAKYKGHGASDLFITPLGRRLAQEREAKGRPLSHVLFVIDASVPYRVFVEVLTTTQESGFDAGRLMVTPTPP